MLKTLIYSMVLSFGLMSSPALLSPVAPQLGGEAKAFTGLIPFTMAEDIGKWLMIGNSQVGNHVAKQSGEAESFQYDKCLEDDAPTGHPDDGTCKTRLP